MENNTLKKLSNHIYYLPPNSDTDRPVLGIISGKQYSLIIDGGNSSNHAQVLLSQIKTKNLPPILAVFLTHWHWDHSFGLHEMNITTICHTQTKTALKKLLPFSWSDEALDDRVTQGIEIAFCADMIKAEYGSNREIHIRIPEITFHNEMEIDLGDIHCIVEHVGGDHSSDSSIVYIPEDKVLFLGDCLYANMYDGPYHYTIQNILALLAKIEKYDADTYVLSHQMPQSKHEFTQFTTLLKTLCQLTETFKGNKKQISEALSKHTGEPLDELAQECIEYFTNIYKQT
ncbi:MBL fold metallo-hydrolase [Bacillus massiliigorillae]|uniref:MBL fold metallo-hydrolase n=1 Tax=Bacillus massiliigorillae TaxID=1243664 RepID=UPI0003A12BC5|nr:MBL fold metallo-hydrolase [Bacillus massiliigorillae]